MTRKIKPGDRCRFIRVGGVLHTMHHDPCDEHPGGTITDVSTGKVVEGAREDA